jgi:uncharacterized protein YjbJ (UPF0337 family)
MGELIDKAKGKAKRVAGAISGDSELEAEGHVDEAKGKVKGKFEEAKQQVKRAISDEPSPSRR